MFRFRRLTVYILLLQLAVPTLPARTRKGEEFVKQGREAEVRKQWEVALDLYEKAMLEDPADPAYNMAARRVRFQAAMARVDAGQKLRAQGKLEAALAEFQRAYAIDPSSAISEQEVRRTRELLDREKGAGGASIAPEERAMTAADKAQREMEERSDRMLPIPELRPLTRQLNSPLKINNQPVKVLFETIGKLAGINVVFDPEYQAAPGRDRFTVDLSNSTLEEAFDFVAVQTKSFWKPLSSNTIFVTNDNVTKRRDYEDYVVKVLYVKNVTTVQELQELSVTLRSVAEIRRAFTYNAQWAILVRGTADQVALCEKLIQDLDKPKSEVVVDVVVMEASRGRMRDLGATLTTSGTNGINVPIFPGTRQANSGNGGDDDDDDDDDAEAPGTIRLNKIASLGLGDFSTIIPGALLQAAMTDSQTRILQQPQVRAVELFKASLKIGDRVPYATGSFQPGIGSVGGVSPLVSTQFQYIDTGVNIDITPKVHGRTEVSLHVEVDLNNVSREVDLGGITQPVITQRKVVHDIRLREGEVNLLGGLISTQESRRVAGIPFLANIPILGRFFGPEHFEINRGELMIALIPHVVRAPEYTESNLRSVSAGNDANLKLTYSPRPEPKVPAAPAGTPAPATPATTPGTTPIPGAGAAPAVNPGGLQLTFNGNPVQAQLSAATTVQLLVQNATDLFSAPVRVKFDPRILRLTSASAGSLMTGDGARTTFSENTQNDIGEASITISRAPGSGSVSGSGTLLTLTFQAIAKGSSAVTVVDAGWKNTQLLPISVALPATTINVE